MECWLGFGEKGREKWIEGGRYGGKERKGIWKRVVYMGKDKLGIGFWFLFLIG